MEKIKVNLFENSYNVYTGVSLSDFADYLKERNCPGNLLVITDTIVGKIYGGRVMDKLVGCGFMPAIALIPAGEKYKTLDTVKELYSACIDAELDRHSLIIALGGGVVGDISGFVAATFKRGVPFVQVPTTLLAMVDASVGGKTGVNLKESKNLIGSFYQPKMVFTDISTLKTLKKREFASGISEIIKYGVIKDKSFFGYIEKNIGRIKSLDPKALEYAVNKSCVIKKGIVEIDEKESGIRAILNFGHTIGHAIEAVTEYKKYLHGEAVAIGMVCASDISVRLGIFGKKDAERLKNLIKKAGLPVNHRLNADKIIRKLIYDKKVKNGKTNFILPFRKIGSVVIKDDVPEKIINDALREVKK